MIISAGARCDVARWYAPWLMRRLNKGFVLVASPANRRMVTRYRLDPSVVDCLVFTSRDYRPLLPALPRVIGRFNTLFQVTINAYGPLLEPGVPGVDDAVASLKLLEALVGAKRITWRYGPVLLWGPCTEAWHLAEFDRLCGLLAGHVGRCAFSFVRVMSWHEYTFPELREVTADEQERLARGFAEIALGRGVELHSCGHGAAWADAGVGPSGCATLELMAEANGVGFRSLMNQGNREGCGCFKSRDVGAYECCPAGCRYCFANKDARKSRRAWREDHDPDSPMIVGHPEEKDKLYVAEQRPIALPEQLTLGL